MSPSCGERNVTFLHDNPGILFFILMGPEVGLVQFDKKHML